jgi:hypothetical protein
MFALVVLLANLLLQCPMPTPVPFAGHVGLCVPSSSQEDGKTLFNNITALAFLRDARQQTADGPR